MTKIQKNAMDDTALGIIESLQDLNLLEGLNYKARRKLKKTIRRFVKHNLLDILSSREDVEEFIVNVFDGVSPASEDGVKVTIGFLRELKHDGTINLQPRSYQREKVSDYEWDCHMIHTILIDKHFKIPPIHIRIIRDDEGKVTGYEVADGQQRVSAILRFMDGEYTLPDDKYFGKFKGKNYSQICIEHPQDAKDMKNYGLSTVFYDNFSDEDIQTLFIDILNNTNDLKVQEKCNATRSYLADFVRYTSRDGDGTWLDTQEIFHDLFTRVTTGKGASAVTEWMYFGKMSMGRMEGDHWLASLIYLYMNGWTGGVTPAKVFKFYRETSQEHGHDFGWNFKKKLSTNLFPNLENDIIRLLDIGKRFGDYVLKHADKSYLRPNFMLFVLLFINDTMTNLNTKKVNIEVFGERMIALYDKWNDEKVYEKDENGEVRKQDNGTTALGAFKSLWGAFNTNVIKTALNIVKLEMDLEPDWGFVELDKKRTFSPSDIEKRWRQVGKVCEYTGESISLQEAVGDHATPYSWGVKMGGVTEYHNLRVTTAFHNREKLQMDEDAYRLKLEMEKKVA